MTNKSLQWTIDTFGRRSLLLFTFPNVSRVSVSHADSIL